MWTKGNEEGWGVEVEDCNSNKENRANSEGRACNATSSEIVSMSRRVRGGGGGREKKERYG